MSQFSTFKHKQCQQHLHIGSQLFPSCLCDSSLRMEIRLVSNLDMWILKYSKQARDTHKDQWDSRVSSQIYKFLINHLHNLKSGESTLIDYHTGYLKALLAVYRVDHHVPINVNAVLDWKRLLQRTQNGLPGWEICYTHPDPRCRPPKLHTPVHVPGHTQPLKGCSLRHQSSPSLSC